MQLPAQIRASARRLSPALLLPLALFGAACGGGGQTGQPTATSAPAATAAPAAQPTAAPSPAAAAAPTTGPAPSPAAPKPAASPAAPAASPSPAAAAPRGGIRLTFAPEGNEARFRAQEQLTGRNLPNEAVGVSKGVSGAVVLGPNGALVPDQSKVTVDLTQIASDQSRRDNFIKQNTLEVQRFPNAEFVPREARGLANPLPTSGEGTFELLGDLTVHGTTKPTTWQVTARFEDGQVSGQAKTRVKMTDFGMTPPRVGPVLSLEDELGLEIDFRANREAGPSAGGPASGSVQPIAATSSAVVSEALPGAAAAPAAAVRSQPATCEPTPSDALGPFYKPGAPVRESVGSGYVLSGTVRAVGSCEPVPGAQVELWLANDSGQYDDDHRATLFAGPQGEYRFESNSPPPYTGRPPHIHIRVSTPDGRVLVTQHYPVAGQSEAVFDLVL